MPALSLPIPIKPPMRIQRTAEASSRCSVTIELRVVRPKTWDPGQDETVNKQDLSTGENGEFGVEVALCELPGRFAGMLRLILQGGVKTTTHAKCCGYGRSL